MAVNKNNCPLFRCILLVLIQYALRPHHQPGTCHGWSPFLHSLVSLPMHIYQMMIYLCGSYKYPVMHTQVDVYYVGSSCVWVYKTSKETKCCTFNNISYCLLIQFNWLQFIVLHYLIPLQYVTHLLSIPRTFINT